MAKWIWAAALAGVLGFSTQAEARERKGRMTRIEQRELDQLRRNLAELEQEYARKEAELAALQGRGVGGAGLAGAPVGILYRGTIAMVSTRNRELNLRDPEGHILVFPLTRQTRAYRKGQRIAIDSIRRGTPVRVSMDLVGTTDHGRRPVREILVDSGK